MSTTTRLTTPALVAAVAALSVAAIPATAAQAKVKKLVHIDRCASIYADKPITQQRAETSELAMNCLINRARAAEGVPPLKLETKYAPNGGGIYQTPLWKSATNHAQESVATKFWRRDNGQVSHLNPGDQVPSDPQQFQALVNQRINERILGAGYCAGGHSWTDAENTYSASGMNQPFPPTPRGAVGWWLSDPPHHATLMRRDLTEHRIGIVPGSAFPGTEYPPAGTFVEDLGTCS